MTLLTRATQPIESGRLKVGSNEYRKYKRLQDQANRQLNLLRNDQGGSTELSEFYPYRYLASEGFLPGYNFTRLPLRIFVPTGSTDGEYISRPRSVALREFGPLKPHLPQRPQVPCLAAGHSGGGIVTNGGEDQ